MNDVNWQLKYHDWIGKVRLFLRQTAQAYLSDTPRLPETLAQQIVPLSQKAQEIKNDYQDDSGNLPEGDPDLLWLDQVSQFLRELSSVYLSDQPSLPQNLFDLSSRARQLAKEAQRIQDNGSSSNAAHAPTGETSSSDLNEDGDSPLPPAANHDLTIEDLQKKIKIQWANSQNPNAPEWQQLIVLLDVAKGLYRNLV
ncbi:hypothetical protein PJF56_11250 [Roseofilum sp. BLCC_M91]|uniref:Inorganic pyrophosphatase n=1 Tax=Roseofilum halophilum BLCC-M91 TaxID=3022259 RepID=A0ABT7BJV4_9CYAN|nr:hypothetical protein [Roseofilum halophilum]MDJ1179439.1 hypothetical protein [Roseofilum halophilum BLCC-M91]